MTQTVTYHVQMKYFQTIGVPTEAEARQIAAEADRDIPGRAPHKVIKRTITDAILPEIK